MPVQKSPPAGGVTITFVSCAHWRPLKATWPVRAGPKVVFRMSKSAEFTFPSSERNRTLEIVPRSASQSSDFPAVLIVRLAPRNWSRLKLTDAPAAHTSPSIRESVTVRTALPSDRRIPAVNVPSRFRADPWRATNTPLLPAYRVIAQSLPTVELIRVRRPLPVILTTARLHPLEPMLM